MESDPATRGMSVGWRLMIRSRDIGHGGGGVRPNADGPRPWGRWIERLEIVIRSDMAVDGVWGEVRRKSGEWRGRSKSGVRLIHFYEPPPGWWMVDGGWWMVWAFYIDA
jgi:hypothetical protein